jgi:hypothetical protein
MSVAHRDCDSLVDGVSELAALAVVPTKYARRRGMTFPVVLGLLQCGSDPCPRATVD